MLIPYVRRLDCIGQWYLEAMGKRKANATKVRTSLLTSTLISPWVDWIREDCPFHPFGICQCFISMDKFIFR